MPKSQTARLPMQTEEMLQHLPAVANSAHTSKRPSPSTAPSWVDFGLELQWVEKQKAWADSAPTFTQWVKQRAPQLGVSEVTLWRALSAVERYKEIKEATAARGVVLPDLHYLPAGLSAQSVELVEKIGRVAPNSVFDDLARRLVSREVSRENLRLVWQKFEPLLGGATNRGGGAKPARPSPSRQALAARSLEALVVDALINTGPAWLGAQRPTGHAVFSDVVTEGDRSSATEFDAVVVVRLAAGARCELHGIEVKGNAASVEVLHSRLSVMAKYADFVWLATSSARAKELAEKAPGNVGILVVAGTEIRVLRPALMGQPARAEALLRALVLPASGR